EACVTAGAVTGLLDRLEAKGLLRRERDPLDRRAIRVWLTPAGRELRAPLMGIIRTVNEKALEGLSEAERRQLARMLEHVGKNVGTKDGSRPGAGGGTGGDGPPAGTRATGTTRAAGDGRKRAS